MPIAKQGSGLKASLMDRIKHSYEHRDDSGQFKSIFMDGQGLKFWKCKSGEHLFDVIPYIAGPNDPNAKEGELVYVLILWVHYSVGQNQDTYICLARNYRKPCPICEYREQLRSQEDYDEDLVKELMPKKRSIYNVWVHDSDKEEQLGVQIFDVAHWYMEKHLSALAKIPSRGGKMVDSWIPFPDPNEGFLVSFERKGEKKNSEFLAHKFTPRDYIIPPELLEKAPSIDAFVIIPTYDEIAKAFYGETAQEEELPEEETQEEERPAPILKKTMKPTPKQEEDEMVCPAGGEFGVQCMTLDACEGCEIWNECSAKADELAAEQAPEPPPKPKVPLKPAAPAPAKETTGSGPRPIRRPIPIKR